MSLQFGDDDTSRTRGVQPNRKWAASDFQNTSPVFAKSSWRGPRQSSVQSTESDFFRKLTLSRSRSMLIDYSWFRATVRKYATMPGQSRCRRLTICFQIAWVCVFVCPERDRDGDELWSFLPWNPLPSPFAMKSWVGCIMKFRPVPNG